MPVVLTAWFIWQPLMTCVLHSSWSCASFLNSSKLINPRHHQTISSLQVRCVWLSTLPLVYCTTLNSIINMSTLHGSIKVFHRHAVYLQSQHFSDLCTCLPVFQWHHTHTPISSFSSHFSLTQSASLEPETFFHGHHGLRRVPKVSLVRPLATAGTGGITNPTAKQWRKTTGDKSWQEQTKNWNCIYLSASTCRCQ